MRSIALFVLRRRRAVIVFWIVMTAVGFGLAPLAIDRLSAQFGVPGYSAYEANKRVVEQFGNGSQPPLTLVFQAPGDVTKVASVQATIEAAAAAVPGSRVSSAFSAAPATAYVSADRHTTFANIYPAGFRTFGPNPDVPRVEAALKATPPTGATVNLTGTEPLQLAEGGDGSGGPSLLVESLIAGFGALIILMFVFGTVPAVLMPLMIAIVSIMTTFASLYVLTFATDVSVIVQFLVSLVGLGIAIDYALLIIFRFREELAAGKTVDDAIIETVTHAGKAVVISGSTVAVGLLSMILIPLPFIRSIGLGGMLIPAVSVVAAVTLLPACLSLLGHRINRWRVIPARFTRPGDDANGMWNRWARLVMRRPVAVSLVGGFIVLLLLIPAVKLHPADAEARFRPGAGPAIDGRDQLAAAGITAGVLKPYVVVIEGKAAPDTVAAVTKAVGADPGIAAVANPDGWAKPGMTLVEAFPDADGSSTRSADTISRLQGDVLPPVATATGDRVTLGGQAPEERDFVKAVYGNFPYVLAFVIVLTYLLLARAFRSLVLPLKAVILNLVSLGAAYGIVVFVFQQGHGSQAIFNVAATQSIISWIPLMIFAFLYGISMDYEVFMLARIREEYDLCGSTRDAVARGLAATGKLVTSASLILMFAFLVLALSPGLDVKQFAVGLAAGIVFDATIIRVLLVPSLMRILGRYNWWMPDGVARILRVAEPAVVPEAAS
jgi:RND superfamily putative drug exporter